MKALEVESCLTVRELKDWLAQIPDKTSDGEDCETWIETGRNLSSPVVRVCPLNRRHDDDSEWCDVLLVSAVFAGASIREEGS